MKIWLLENLLGGCWTHLKWASFETGDFLQLVNGTGLYHDITLALQSNCETLLDRSIGLNCKKDVLKENGRNYLGAGPRFATNESKWIV